jgi:hypothetical protein
LISGGNLSPPQNINGNDDGIVVENGAALTVTSGQISSGNGAYPAAVSVQDVSNNSSPSSLSISVGTFLGDYGISVFNYYGGSVTISGGTFSSNNVQPYYGMAADIAFVYAPGTVTISGGTFNAFPEGALAITNATFTVSGGKFNGTTYLYP